MPGSTPDPPVRNNKQNEALRDKGMSKPRAASVANFPGASSNGGKSKGSSRSARNSGNESGGNKARKQAAGRMGARDLTGLGAAAPLSAYVTTARVGR